MPATRVQLSKKRKIPLENAREWISFEDPEEERTWVFDVTFMMSAWRCIFGDGCQGVLTGPTPELVQGCCSYGAHFTDEDDEAKIIALSKRLTPSQWQFYAQGNKRGVTKRTRDGEIVSRLVDDACVFLNRPGFPGGPGCALHRAALDVGERPLDWKPNVCWQLPIRHEDDESEDGHITTTISQWERRHWGSGGDDFHWWCSEAPEAFTAADAVYVTLRDELVEMVGLVVYDMLVRYLENRPVAPLRHPVERPSSLIRASADQL